MGVPIAPAAASDPPPTRRAGSRAGRWLVGIGLILIAWNLRALFSSLSAVLPEAMGSTGAGPVAGSIVTTVPVLCLGLFSFPAAPLARRIGSERSVFLALLAIAAGTAARGLATVPTLVFGGLLAGAGIAVCNVLLPGLVKREFPDRLAVMTGLYSMSLSGGAAVAAALTVPVARAAGSWAVGLAIWALPALAAAGLWLPQALRRHAPAEPRSRRSLWGNRLAWSVSLFMGLQSTLAYCVFGWLAPILRDRGLDAAAAGYVLSISVVGQMMGCLAAPSLAVGGRDHRVVSSALYALVLLGILGCFYAPLPDAWASAALLGLGQGGLLGVALTVILLRAPDAATASALSGMAQGIGYTMAAAGPFAVGLIRQATGGFAAVPALFAALIVLGVLAGLAAARDRVLET